MTSAVDTSDAGDGHVHDVAMNMLESGVDSEIEDNNNNAEDSEIDDTFTIPSQPVVKNDR